MNLPVIRSLFVLLSASLLAACTTDHRMATAPDEPAAVPRPARNASPYETENVLLKFRGQNAAEVLANRETISGLLDDLRVPAQAKLGARIRQALNDPQSDEFNGLGGVQVGALLEAALASVNASDEFDSDIGKVEVVGQIQPFVVTLDGTPEIGFRFDERRRSGHLWVEMRTISTAKTGKTTQFAEMFRVEIAPGGFEVDTRKPEMPGKGVFHDFADKAFPVSAGMATNKDGTPFDFKLWAVGTDVTVTDYWSTRTFDSATDTALYKASEKHRKDDTGLPKRIARIFQPTAKDCVDMMFVRDPRKDMPQGSLIGGYLPSSVKPPQYCLGRCTNPPTVNTK